LRYYKVTRVNEAAGDNPLMSLAGFFIEKTRWPFVLGPASSLSSAAEEGQRKKFLPV